MEKADGDPDALRRIAADATAEQLILLNRRFGIAAAQLRMEPPFARHAGEAASELSEWVVSRGQKTWADAMKDPRTLPRRAPADVPDFPGVIANVYRERFGGDIPEQEPAPTITSAKHDPAWEQQLWELIDVLNLGVPVEQAVAGYTRSELLALIVALQFVTERISNKVHGTVGGEWSSLDPWLWANLVVGQGKETVDGYLADFATAPREPDIDNDDAILSRLESVYWDRYNKASPAISLIGV